MTTPELERRLEDLERDVLVLKDALRPAEQRPDWRRTVGVFADDPEFEEIVRLGAEYRRQQRQADEPC